MRNLLTKRIMKWHVALFIALAVPGIANAQFGSLLKKAKSAVTNSSNDADAARSNAMLNAKVRQNESGLGNVGSGSTASKSSSLNKIYKGTSWDEKDVIATWDDNTKQFTLVRKYTDGELAGQPIVYAFDEATGEMKRNDGKLMATIKGDDVIIPDRGTVTIDLVHGGGLLLDGNYVGKVTRTDGTSFGKDLFHFRKDATRQLVAFFLMTEFLSPEEYAKLKSAREKQRQAEENATAAFKAELLKQPVGKFYDNTGALLGQITAGGDVLNSRNQRMGKVKAGGVITNPSGQKIGSVDAKGIVYDGIGSNKGMVQPNGGVNNSSGSSIGTIMREGKIQRGGSEIGTYKGTGRYMAAVCYFLFFNFR